MNQLRVKVNGAEHHVPTGTTVAAIFGQLQIQEQEIVAAVLDQHLVNLATPISGDVELEAVRRNDPLGRAVMRRTISHIFLAAALKRFPELNFFVGQSLYGGYYYEIRSSHGSCSELCLEQLARDLSAAYDELVRRDEPFLRRVVSVSMAQTLVTNPLGSKARLLTSWPSPMISLVELAGFVDLPHGPYAPSTSFGDGARVVPYPPGLILQFGVDCDAPPAEQERSLWLGYRETVEWNRRLGIGTVGDLNDAILSDRFSEVERIAEALHEKKLAEIADSIAKHSDQIRVVCIAGPSSAGKSTFVQRLSIQLRVNGLHPVHIGLDDYYRKRSETPRDSDGELDFEALEALDLRLLDEHLAALLQGKTVAIPRFDFNAGSPAPEDQWRPLALGEGMVLLIEGIHGLNPRITRSVPDTQLFRIYINALTQLVIDEHNRIFTSDTRLLRRIVRDRRYRGTSAAETIARWPSVRRGERTHIYPFHRFADAMFNSALVYEGPVLRSFAWRYLLEVPRDHPSRIEAYRLLKFLELFVPVLPDGVPVNSVLREFIGGSGFHY